MGRGVEVRERIDLSDTPGLKRVWRVKGVWSISGLEDLLSSKLPKKVAIFTILFGRTFLTAFLYLLHLYSF